MLLFDWSCNTMLYNKAIWFSLHWTDIRHKLRKEKRISFLQHTISRSPWNACKETPSGQLHIPHLLSGIPTSTRRENISLFSPMWTFCKEGDSYQNHGVQMSLAQKYPQVEGSGRQNDNGLQLWMDIQGGWSRWKAKGWRKGSINVEKKVGPSWRDKSILPIAAYLIWL